MWKSSLKTWLIQSSNLNSWDAVLDLFNVCIVLYVRFRYFLEFTFAILGFVLLAERIREPMGRHVSQIFSVLKGYLHRWITLGVFALAPIAFKLLLPCHYTHIRLVLWVKLWNYSLQLFVWWEFSLRRRRDVTVCFTFIEIWMKPLYFIIVACSSFEHILRQCNAL